MGDEDVTTLFFFFLVLLGMWDLISLFPEQGSNSIPLPWKHEVLTTGPPGNSLECVFKFPNAGGFLIYHSKLKSNSTACGQRWWSEGYQFFQILWDFICILTCSLISDGTRKCMSLDKNMFFKHWIQSTMFIKSNLLIRDKMKFCFSLLVIPKICHSASLYSYTQG